MLWTLRKLVSPASNVVQINGTSLLTTKLLAEGGYAYVHLVTDAKNNTYALKRMLALDDDAVACANTEVELLRKFSHHPGFVTCLGTSAKTHKHRPNRAPGPYTEFYMLLEYCPNGSLVDLLYSRAKDGSFARRPPLELLRVLDVFEMVVSSVAHMHKHGWAHRDLKLENVLATAEGRYVLCDFGSATNARYPGCGSCSKQETVMQEERISKYSTLMYRAPEMCDLHRGHVIDERVDVWALGCILFSLCFREHPFSAESTLSILNAAYRIPDDSRFPPSVHALIRAMLTANPTERPTADAILGCVRTLKVDPHLDVAAVNAVLEADRRYSMTPTRGPRRPEAMPVASAPPTPAPAFEARFDEPADSFQSASGECAETTCAVRVELHIAGESYVTVGLVLTGCRSAAASPSNKSRTSRQWVASFRSSSDDIIVE